MLVHPSTTNTPLHRQSSDFLSRILDVASPRAAKFHEIWTFARRRKRRLEDLEDEEEPHELEKESLFSQAEGIWDVIEWSFFQGRGGWVDLLNLIVRVVRNDFEECKRGIIFE
jgi:hypothetical protein